MIGTGVHSPAARARCERAQQADERRDPGDRGDEEMRLVEERRVAQKESLGTPANNELTADTEREQRIGELAVGHTLDEQLDLVLESVTSRSSTAAR